MEQPRREAVRPLRRRAGVLLQLGRRGGRGGAQVGAQGDRPQPGSSRSRARSTAARWARSRSPASRRSARRSSRSSRASASRRPRRSPTHVGPETAAILLEPVQGEGGVHPLAAETLAAGARARRRARRAARLRRGADRRRPHRRRSSPGSELGVRPDAVTLAKGLANGLPIGALLVADDAPSGFVPGDHASTFGGNPVVVRGGRAPSSTRSTTTCSPTCATLGARFEARAFDDVRGAGLLLAVELDRPARPGRRRRARARPRSSAPPARRRCGSRRRSTISAEEADQALEILRGGARVTTKFERQGAILRLVERAHALDAGRGRRGAARRRASTPCRRRSRATSRSSGSSRCGTATAGSSTRCRAPPTSTGSTQLAVGAPPLGERRSRPAGNLLVIATPRGFAAPLADAIDDAALAEVAGHDRRREHRLRRRARRPDRRRARRGASRHHLERVSVDAASTARRRSSTRCPSASASASRSPAASTRAARSRGCASTARSRTRSPPTSASTTSPTSRRVPDEGAAVRRRGGGARRLPRRARARGPRRAAVRRVPHPDRRARATSTRRRSAAPSPGRCSCRRWPSTASTSGATARRTRATTSSASTATGCSRTRTCASTSRGSTAPSSRSSAAARR